MTQSTGPTPSSVCAVTHLVGGWQIYWTGPRDQWWRAHPRDAERFQVNSYCPIGLPYRMQHKDKIIKNFKRATTGFLKSLGSFWEQDPVSMCLLHAIKAGPGFDLEKCKKLPHCHIARCMGKVGIYRLARREMCAGNRGWAVLSMKSGLNTVTTEGWKFFAYLFILLFDFQ